MTEVITISKESSIGPLARSLRIALRLTQRELAEDVGVLKEDVDLLENNLPIPLDTKRRLLKKLYAVKSANESQLRLSL
ncbi:helix-turn-helix domain-containing protein [Chloroflexota bacterium]